MAHEYDGFGDLVIKDIPEEMTLPQALVHAYEVARHEGRHCFELKTCGMEFVFGVSLMEAMEKLPCEQQEACARKFLVGELGAMKALAFPGCDRYPDVAKAFPFQSASLTEFLMSPIGALNETAVMDYLRKAEKEYADYLFETLPKAGQTGNPALFNDFLHLIDSAVLDHISNSRQFLTPERRKLLEDETARQGLLSEGLRHSFRTAGIGPSTWDKVEHDLILRAAQQSGKLHKGSDRKQ